jgi:ProP effector
VTIALLAERWPTVFSVFEQRRRPLKIGIHLDILAALDGVVTEVELSPAMRYYVGSPWYLRMMIAGSARIDLDGVAVGTVTDAQATKAAAILERRRIKLQTKPVVTPAAPQTPAPPRISLADLKRSAELRRAKEAVAA